MVVKLPAGNHKLSRVIIAEQNSRVVRAREATALARSNTTISIAVVGAQVLDIILRGLPLCVGLAAVHADGRRVPLRAALLEVGGVLGVVDDGVVGEDVAGSLPVRVHVADLHADFVVGAGDVDDGAAFFDLAHPLDVALGQGELVCGVDRGSHDTTCGVLCGDDGEACKDGWGASGSGEGAAGQGEGEEGEEHFASCDFVVVAGMCLWSGSSRAEV